ncbi:hypothetical protein [Burkholderia seminalis]|uniref:hypothetical protein n=1 Tax=Burkholderia seminalis TaxID=488731 RepID=UPI0026548466|nr:hypothetical protein [Burkholderia seminalis]MDN7847551.1 hypothetical protein [Burkholderia seminalis]
MSESNPQDALIAEGINRVFEHRKNFLVIGLTGRTGSGCTTAAKILSSESFSKLKLPRDKNPPIHHEDRKQRIVRLWAEKHWRPFTTISATGIILALALEEGLDTLINTVQSIDATIDIERLRSELANHETEIKSAFKIARSLHSGEWKDHEISTAAEALSSGAISILDRAKVIFTNHGITYTKLFQLLGNNIRCSGSPTQQNIDPSKIFTIPETIEIIIRLLRKSFEIRGITQKYIAIDALRHPYEIRYLRERISSFYTLAVNTTDQERQRRLQGLHLTDIEIKNLDEIEYPNKIAKAKDYSHLVKQNIQACLELADIYISNIGHDGESRHELTRQLVRYITLMQHPGLVTPTAIERCMQSALTAKANSGCISRQVGAVVTDPNYSVKAIGWNDVPQGQVPCILRNVAHLAQGDYDLAAYSDYERNDEGFQNVVIESYGISREVDSFEGRNLSYCFKSAYNKKKNNDKQIHIRPLPAEENQVHTRSLHAEENAFLQIAKYGGQSISGGYLFTTASPCELCAKKAYQLGIKKIYYIDPYPGIATNHVLGSGNARPELHLFEGAIGTAYHDLYQPVMAYKDELPRLIAGRLKIDH